MALKPFKPLFSVEDQIDSITITDCTGKQSSQNPGGLGGTNFGISDVTSVLLEVTSVSNGKKFSQQLEPNFPSDQGLSIILSPGFLGSTDGRVPSGIYIFKLTYTGPAIMDITVSNEFVFTKTVRFDVDQLRTQTLMDCIETERSKRAEELTRLLDKAEWAANMCGAANVAQVLLNFIIRQVKICC